MFLQTFEGHESSVLKVNFLTRGMQLVSRFVEELEKVLKFIHICPTMLICCDY